MTETRSLHRKLAQVMYEAERIPKRGKAPQAMGGFEFVQVGDAADFIRKALAEKVITMMPTHVQIVGQSEHQTKAGGSMTTVDLITDWTLTDGESGETIVIQSFGAGADAGDKYSGKAQTNAMKYALLMGFLLSTGDDPELSDTSDRQARRRREPTPGDEMPADVAQQPRSGTQRPAPPPAGPEHHVGTVAVGKPPVDCELRQTPDGAACGFSLVLERGKVQVLASDAMAEALSYVVKDAIGQQVNVWGRVEAVAWEKDGKPMPPYRRLHLERIVAPTFTIPGAVRSAEEAELDGMAF